MFEQMMLLQLSAEAQDAAQRTFGILIERVQDAMNSGDLFEGNNTEIAQLMWSAMHGAVSLEIAGVHFAADRAANYMAMIDAMLVGLRGEPPLHSTLGP